MLSAVEGDGDSYHEPIIEHGTRTVRYLKRKGQLLDKFHKTMHFVAGFFVSLVSIE
jgi:hypothetical protein